MTSQCIQKVKTKIICTLGPATDDEQVLRHMLTHGMSVARMNFSHGDHAEHLARLTRFRELCEELGVSTAVMMDTKGPEIRLGCFEGGSAELIAGHLFTLTSRDVMGNAQICTISYDKLCKDIGKGQALLLDDGLIELTVLDIEGGEIHCKVVNGGVIGNRKSVNAPNAALNMPALSQKDIDDLQFAIENDFDFIALSFVRDASDVMHTRRILEKGNANIRIIAKIENRQGLENVEDIIRASDGLMVARGDLGVEIPLEEVPVVQKRLIKQCTAAGKPVITATQMLDSMIRNPRPTRAEVSDVANAIYDGTSCLMLSGETAIGKYPAEALDTMMKIAMETESSIHYWQRFERYVYEMPYTITNAISHATCTAAMNLSTAAILTVTKTGKTARMISRFRPDCPIIAVTTSRKCQRQLMMSWGVYPLFGPEVASTDELFNTAVDGALKSGMVAFGDLVAITAGVPVGVSGTTNILKIQVVGNVLVNGRGMSEHSYTGVLCVPTSLQEAKQIFNSGSILVIDDITNEWMPFIRKAGALVVEGDHKSGYAETVSQALDIPVIVGAGGATHKLMHDSIATVDASRGLVFQPD